MRSSLEARCWRKRFSRSMAARLAIDSVLVLAAPSDEGGLGDIELGGNIGEDPALNAEFDEALNSFIVVHIRSFPAGIFPGFFVRRVFWRTFDDYRFKPGHTNCVPDSHPIPPGKAQTKVWKQPHHSSPAPQTTTNVFAGQRSTAPQCG
jgi:hypothetical protein